MARYFVNTSTVRFRGCTVAHGGTTEADFVITCAAQSRILLSHVLALCLIWITMGCSTPKETTQDRLETSSESRLETYQAGEADDSTTIIHQRRDDSTIITKIIRRITYENREASRSNSDSTAVGLTKRTDTITPELVKAIAKGFAVACIGVGLTVLGLLLIVVLLLFRSSKRGHQP